MKQSFPFICVKAILPLLFLKLHLEEAGVSRALVKNWCEKWSYYGISFFFIFFYLLFIPSLHFQLWYSHVQEWLKNSKLLIFPMGWVVVNVWNFGQFFTLLEWMLKVYKPKIEKETALSDFQNQKISYADKNLGQSGRFSERKRRVLAIWYFCVAILKSLHSREFLTVALSALC